ATLEVSGTPAFFHSLVWLEVDAGDVVAEQREDDNRAALYGDCEVAPGATSLEPMEEWYLPGVEVETAPIVVQLSDDDGDGSIDSRDTPDVVFQTVDAEGNAVLAVSGLDGRELWRFRSTPANPITIQVGQVAAGDLDGDGVAEVIAHQRDGRLIALDHAGRLSWVSDKVEGVGDRGLGGPLLADLDGDGVPEIVLGRSVISNEGKLLAVGTANRGRNTNYYGPLGVTLVPGATDYSHPAVADVDLDGVAEIVAGDAVYRLNGNTLEVVWDQTVPDKLMVDGFSAVGNLDADPQAEIVYVSSNQIIAFNHDGSLFASRRVMTPFLPLVMPTYWGGPPTIADVDGDGRANVLVATATELIAFEAGLGVKWRRPIGPDFGGITGVSAFDLDGDGVREVLFLDERTFYILDGATGAVVHSRPNKSKTGSEYPVAADVDGDGLVEVLVPSNVSSSGDASTQGLHVLGHPSWRGARATWNQYGYQAGHVLLDGTVPSAPAPSWLTTNTYRVNLELPRPALYRPNLTVSRPRVGAATAEGVPITVRVGNGGRSSVGPGHVLELSAGAGEPLTAVVESGLRAGAWVDVTLQWQA
ncbi:MAG TPA: VCBS repeat-containing protein, partial [Thermoanaerobaculia bacterium]